MVVIGWAFVLMAAALQRWSPAVNAANVEIGRGVDVLQRIGIIGDMLFGGAPKNKDMITHDILSNANIITDVVNITNQPMELNITFCSDLDSLFDAYFKGFRVDLSETPWKLLTASWSSYTISERFGIPNMAVSPNYQFVLVSYTRPIKMYKAVKNLTQLAYLKSSVVEKLKSISIDVESKVIDFVAEYGSHYVDEYTVGDCVFQVFTYLPIFYTKFQKCFYSNYCSDFEQSVFLSPVFAEYIGQVMTIGNKGEVEKWADTNLSSKSRIGGTYTSLFTMKINPRLFNEIAILMDDQSVLKMHLKIISIFLNDTVTKMWFTEVLDNHIKLREINL